MIVILNVLVCVVSIKFTSSPCLVRSSLPIETRFALVVVFPSTTRPSLANIVVRLQVLALDQEILVDPSPSFVLVLVTTTLKHENARESFIDIKEVLSWPA